MTHKKCTHVRGNGVVFVYVQSYDYKIPILNMLVHHIQILHLKYSLMPSTQAYIGYVIASYFMGES